MVALVVSQADFSAVFQQNLRHVRVLVYQGKHERCPFFLCTRSVGVGLFAEELKSETGAAADGSMVQQGAPIIVLQCRRYFGAVFQ